MLPFLPISAWRNGELAMGLAAVSLGDVLCGVGARRQERVAYLRRRFFE
jgi:hypothetical protein